MHSAINTKLESISVLKRKGGIKEEIGMRTSREGNDISGRIMQMDVLGKRTRGLP